ncbi:MAG: ribosome silencing factor [Spirochaetia bacterium]|jgi:ribosome-associated protein|nr:ribosome silencing factor [Spirochaetia bacterium]
MDATANSRQLALRVARAIEEHRGQDTVALDIAKQSSFTDCFVITTVTSQAHMQGLYKNILDFFDKEKAPLPRRRKNIAGEGWLILDCGSVVIHLMTQQLRAFYDLERLWFEGEIIFHSSSNSSS